jgi:DNA-binding response OmpR family regulator
MAETALESRTRTVLVVEDDRKIADVVRIYLEREQYRPILVSDGRQALARMDAEQPDLVVLDLLLPGLDGREVCRLIRQQSRVPIIMLTALSSEDDTLRGLDLGADDYLTKPFSPRELMARIRTVLRRAEGRAETAVAHLRVGALCVDRERRQASIGTYPLNLTRAEFALLALLASQPGRVYSRAQLIDAAFGDAFDGFERTVDSHIKNLRRKLQDAPAAGTPAIATVYGIGYSLEAR